MKIKLIFEYRFLILSLFIFLNCIAYAQDYNSAYNKQRREGTKSNEALVDLNRQPTYKTNSYKPLSPNEIQAILNYGKPQKTAEQIAIELKKEKELNDIVQAIEEKRKKEKAENIKISQDKRAYNRPYIKMLKDLGLLEVEAEGIINEENRSLFLTKIVEINNLVEFLQSNIETANFTQLQTALEELIYRKVPLTAFKFINKLDRFKSNEIELDKLKMRALDKFFELNYVENSFFGLKDYDTNKTIYEGDELKILELYFTLEDKYPMFYSTIYPFGMSNLFDGPYERIDYYYTRYKGFYGDEANRKKTKEAKELRSEYIARRDVKNIVIDENGKSLNVKEAYLSLNGLKALAAIYKKTPIETLETQITYDGIPENLIPIAIQLMNEGDEKITELLYYQEYKELQAGKKMWHLRNQWHAIFINKIINNQGVDMAVNKLYDNIYNRSSSHYFTYQSNIDEIKAAIKTYENKYGTLKKNPFVK